MCAMGDGSDIFAPDFKETPYWWEAAPRPVLPVTTLPARIDVAVVGSGHTGLAAALTLARAGRGVAVFEAGDPGDGASSRNAGFIGATLEHGFGKLFEYRGQDHALAIYREVRAAFDHLFQLIESERIDCALVRGGRFLAALSPRQYQAMARELELRHRFLGEEFEMLPRVRQHREIGSDHYHGGAVTPDRGSLHPGLYHLGLLARALAAGAELHGRTPVMVLRREPDGFELATARGKIKARDVLVATNGYTGPALPWHRRRVVPFHGYMIATEPLTPPLLDRLLPKPRIVQDYNHNIFFMRRAPNDSRLLFGGYTGGPVRDLKAKARRLNGALARIFPELATTRLSHAWSGKCAGTFDLFPHVGVHDGAHYAMGYNFAGLPMGTWLGIKAARKILGAADGATAFDGRTFPTMPFYHGRPWFVPLVMAWYDWQDRRSL
ncbi:MAG: NAD(P)/FAD-dependent oxidoreductase [Dongiaceae bacterium]